MKKTISLLILSALLFIVPFEADSSSDCRIFIATENSGVLVSENGGNSWKNFNNGLTENPDPVKLYKSGKSLYLATFNSGLFRYSSDGTWVNIAPSGFKRRSIYSHDSGFRKISAFSADPDNSNSLAAATKHSLYRSNNGGASWKEIPLIGRNSRLYITSLSISGNRLFAGTAFNGIYEVKGSEFRSAGSGLPGEKYSNSLTIPEQSSSLNYHNGKLYAGFWFGKGLYVKNVNSSGFLSLYRSENSDLQKTVSDIKYHNDSLFFSHGGEVLIYNGKSTQPAKNYNNCLKPLLKRNDIVSAVIEDKNGKYPPVSISFLPPERKKKSHKASLIKAIYLSVPAVQKKLDYHIRNSAKSGINAFVMDMKDDFGNVWFRAEAKTASEIGAQRNPLNISEILKKLKKNNIYSIARLVVFKDPKLWQGYNGKFSIKNRNSGKPWKGSEGEFWVDPFSEFVHNYNIGLARDLEKAGFDEIQFDYIRFPSDGPIHLCNYTYKKNDETYKSEILIDFLSRAKQYLNIPVSVDIYGFNSWYHFGNSIGQDMEELSKVVDVICPMVYPSHFGSRFYHQHNYTIRPYRIVRDGGIRGVQMIDRSAVIRPYLQAFNLLSPSWGPEYILTQINGSIESGCNGFTLWNAKGDYTIPYQALIKENLRK